MKKYDVIIIGSGLAGLSCGYFFTKKGKKVLILEKKSFIGGRTASWKENGMQIESGLHRMLGFYEALPQLMQECELSLSDSFIWEDALEICLSRDISATFNLSLHKPIKTFISAIGNNHFITPAEKVQLIGFLLKGFADLRTKKKELDSLTLAKYARSNNLTEKIIFRVLTPLTEGLFFIPPNRYSAYNFFSLFAPYLHKIYKMRIGAFSKGMTEVMTGPIAKKIQNMGSDVLLNAYVKKIILENKAVKGVELNKHTYLADTVVLATGFKAAELLLLVSDTKGYDPFEKLNAMPSISAQFLLSMPALPHDRVTFSPGTMFASYSEQSRTTFQNTQGRLSVILSHAEIYLHTKKEDIVNALLVDAKKIGIKLQKENIINYRIVRWVNDFYSYAPGNAEHLPDSVTPFKGLYLAGDYTNQKYLQTMEGAVMSGKIVADLM